MHRTRTKKEKENKESIMMMMKDQTKKDGIMIKKEAGKKVTGKFLNSELVPYNPNTIEMMFNNHFDKLKEKYLEEVDKSELLLIAKNVEDGNKRAKNCHPDESFDEEDEMLSQNVNDFQKLLKNDDAELNVLSKLSTELDDEANYFEKKSF